MLFDRALAACHVTPVRAVDFFFLSFLGPTCPLGSMFFLCPGGGFPASNAQAAFQLQDGTKQADCGRCRMEKATATHT